MKKHHNGKTPNDYSNGENPQPKKYQYSDTSFNTNLNIQDKVWWQFCDLKPLHKVLFVRLVLFLSLCIKFLQQGVQVYLKHKEIQKFWVLHVYTVLPRKSSTNTVLTLWHLTYMWEAVWCSKHRMLYIYGCSYAAPTYTVFWHWSYSQLILAPKD